MVIAVHVYHTATSERFPPTLPFRPHGSIHQIVQNAVLRAIRYSTFGSDLFFHNVVALVANGGPIHLMTATALCLLKTVTNALHCDHVGREIESRTHGNAAKKPHRIAAKNVKFHEHFLTIASWPGR